MFLRDADLDTDLTIYYDFDIENNIPDIVKFKSSREQFKALKKGTLVIKHSGERYLEDVEE